MIPTLSIVGKAGVGKTTLIEKLLRELTGRGLRVAAVKHHAHQTPLDTPGKDSARFANAGAAVVVVASRIELARFERQTLALSLEEIAAQIENVDLILAEGFSREPGPKMEILRAAQAATLIATPGDLCAVISDHPVRITVPCFDPDDIEGLSDFILEHACLRETRRPMTDRLALEAT